MKTPEQVNITRTPPRITSGEKREGETIIRKTPQREAAKGKRTRGKDGEEGGVDERKRAEFMKKMMITQGVSEPIFCDYDSFHLKVRIYNQFVPLSNRMINKLSQ